jgi:hypothetical protein
MGDPFKELAKTGAFAYKSDLMSDDSDMGKRIALQVDLNREKCSQRAKNIWKKGLKSIGDSEAFYKFVKESGVHDEYAYGSQFKILDSYATEDPGISISTVDKEQYRKLFIDCYFSMDGKILANDYKCIIDLGQRNGFSFSQIMEIEHDAVMFVDRCYQCDKDVREGWKTGSKSEDFNNRLYKDAKENGIESRVIKTQMDLLESFQT